ncbi:MAG: YggU family protein [Phycisphaerae bacterium]|nr:YggU family protein [Phycisphaerae bacterium]
MSGLAIIETPDGVQLPVKVVPGASRDRIAGLLGDALKIAVAAPPEKGKANQAVIQLLAKAVGVKRQAVEVVAGHTQPRKTIAIAGVTATQLRAALSL